jgi:hypothetical protein
LAAMWTGSKSKQPERPSRGRLDQLALHILERAAAEASAAPIQRTHAHRLALAWLTYTDRATPCQAKSFWDSLGHAGQYAGEGGAFYRQCDPQALLAAWRRRAGPGA